MDAKKNCWTVKRNKSDRFLLVEFYEEENIALPIQEIVSGDQFGVISVSFLNDD